MMRVNILLSAYNGSKYIKEQIDSILNQTYSNIYIYIRDDGSIDDTVSIIREGYRKEIEQGKIILLEGENKGYRYSFIELLKVAQDGDLWAFCDQDDIWYENKIIWAAEWMLNQKNKEIPLLFHSSFELYDEQKKKSIGAYKPPEYEINFRRAITDCVYQGFSIVMNRELRTSLLRCNIENNFSHDWMAGLIVEVFGKACFDARIAALHRRVIESQSGMNLKKRFSWMIQVLKGNSDIKNTACEFYRVYKNELKEEEKEIISWFLLDKYNLAESVKKAFYPKRWRQSISSEIVMRTLMLVGKI